MKIKKYTNVFILVIVLVIIALICGIGLPKKWEESIKEPIKEEIPFGVEDSGLTLEEEALLSDIVAGKETLTPNEWTAIAPLLLEKMIIRAGLTTTQFLNEYSGQNYNKIIRALELLGR